MGRFVQQKIIPRLISLEKLFSEILVFWRLIRPKTGPLARRRLPVLYQQITEYFDEGELQGLAFRVGCDYGELAGDTHSQRCLALELWAVRHGLVGELKRVLGEERPLVDWEG